jgi:heme-degrading monooxygenase HmoA
MAIVRIWHGRTLREKADAYWRFLHDRAIPDYRSTPGNLEVKLLRRVDGDVCHFLTVTTWESMEAIVRFAGVPVDKAKYYAEDRDFLLEFEETVQHFEVSETRSEPT